MSRTWDMTLSFGSLFFVLACEFFAFRRILDISIEMALVLVVVDFVLGRIIINLLVGDGARAVVLGRRRQFLLAQARSTRNRLSTSSLLR